ncbi:MAG: PHP domain-containing protein [Defluviitaleaceae bacterium]|nr:PHP domain-containing protein [Defluviitaleaceae bacterium]
MYNLKVDAHTHTIFTGHAYSTVAENAMIAAEKGLEAIAMTDHFGLQLPWLMSKRKYNLENHLKPENMPKFMRGVRVFNGIEIDITGFDGRLAGSEMPLSIWSHPNLQTFDEYILGTKEVVIASLHYFDGFRDGDIVKNTQMYINVLSRPKVDILGHPVRCGLEFDWREVVAAAKAHSKMVEINTAALRSRPNQRAANMKLAQLCAEAGVAVIASSDAHICFDVGEFGLAVDMLTEIGFPEELIATRSLAAFENALGQSRGAL